MAAVESPVSGFGQPSEMRCMLAADARDREEMRVIREHPADRAPTAAD